MPQAAGGARAVAAEAPVLEVRAPLSRPDLLVEAERLAIAQLESA